MYVVAVDSNIDAMSTLWGSIASLHSLGGDLVSSEAIGPVGCDLWGRFGSYVKVAALDVCFVVCG